MPELTDSEKQEIILNFIVILLKNRIVIMEIKGNAELNAPLKLERLRRRLEDVNRAQDKISYDWVYVEQEEFEKYRPKKFGDMMKSKSR